MKPYVTILMAAASVIIGSARGDDRAPSDLEKLQGVWICVSMERNGEPIPPDRYKGGRLTMEGETFTFKVGNRLVARGIRKLDPSQSPKAVDDTHTEGSFKGKTYRGIYELTDDTFRTCNGGLGAERPKAFSTRPNSGLLLVVYKREKAGAATKASADGRERELDASAPGTRAVRHAAPGRAPGF